MSRTAGLFCLRNPPDSRFFAGTEKSYSGPVTFRCPLLSIQEDAKIAFKKFAMKNDQLKEYQKMLFPYAYNILSSAEDAKDAIQDVMTAFLSVDKSNIENEKAYLVRSVINQSINLRKRRRSVPPDSVWLPEPVATEHADDALNRSDILSYSMLVLLERLNARERAVFILKEAFDYSHQDIAAVLSCSVENSRQLLSRSKSKLGRKERSYALYPENQDRKDHFRKYLQALRSHDIARLESLLSEDVRVETDGGGKVSIVRAVTEGIGMATELMSYVFLKYQAAHTIVYTTVNHQPALLFYAGEELINCQVFDLDADTGLIRNVYSMVDPDKLKHMSRPADAVVL